MTRGKATATGFGKRWKVEIKIGSGGWILLKPNHNWDTEEEHTYGANDCAKVTWSPGQPITVSFTQVGVYNTELVDYQTWRRESYMALIGFILVLTGGTMGVLWSQKNATVIRLHARTAFRWLKRKLGQGSIRPLA